MRLEKYLNQLLFQHDCVIVPKFGAFISHPTSAVIDPEDLTITPPHRTISFNSSLTTSDGILVNTYAHEENIPYDTASTQLEKDVNDWRIRLQQGESIVLDKIGSLRHNAEGKVDFEPQPKENFSPDAFGLPTIKPNLIMNNSSVEDEIVETSPRRWSSLFAIASVIPILVGGYFYFNTPQPVQKFVDHQWSGLVLPAIKDAAPNLINSDQVEPSTMPSEAIHNLPTTIENPLEYIQAGTSVTLPEQTMQDSLGNNVVSKYEITVVEEKQLNEKEKEVKAIIRNSTTDEKNTVKPETKENTTVKKTEDTKAKTPEKAVDAPVKIEANPKKYQVIASSLRRPEDANRMLESLKKDGYKSANVIYVKGRFYYVTYASFDQMDQATKYLNNLHKDHPDAWIREHQ